MLKKLTFAAALAIASVPAAMAAECTFELEGNDAMQFNVKEIVVDKSCEEFTINLQHTGALPIASMGHNVVISKKADEQAVANDGIAAGLDNHYVKPGDERVIAHSDVVGGGDSTSVTFNVADLQEGEDYAFFCSFPGHLALMKGDLKVQ